VSRRNAIKPKAVCVVWSIACIAEEKYIFLIRVTTNRTGVDLLFLEFVLDPGVWVEFGNLFLVLDLVFGYYGTWRKELAFELFRAYMELPLFGG
jgi:hypothetical protein